ncbi:hypothetical protein SGRIM128S_00584 [Streptomyces griseomycini]
MEAASAGSATGRSTQPLSEDQRRVADAGCGGCWTPGPRRAARSLGVGTPLTAGVRSALPFRAPAAGCCGSCAVRSAAAVSADSGSGAERIAAISGRAAGGGVHTPVDSLARTARVIHARSSTRRSSASATRSSDWL